MKKSTKNNLLETGLALAIILGFGKLAVDNHRKYDYQSNLSYKIAEKNQNIERMANLRHDLFFYFNDKSYDELDENPLELTAMSQEYARLISDENNRKDFEDYLKFRSAASHYGAYSVLSVFGGTIPLSILGLCLLNKIKKIKEDKK